ncbi:hypothetical protein JHK87_054452 [Glycine soja]|nr:hypothetical protein JHK87_054452 [Glycine soja]
MSPTLILNTLTAVFGGGFAAMGFSEVFCILGSLIIAFSKVPVYIAEIAPKNLRGAFTEVHQAATFTGKMVEGIYGIFLARLGRNSVGYNV